MLAAIEPARRPRRAGAFARLRWARLRMTPRGLHARRAAADLSSIARLTIFEAGRHLAELPRLLPRHPDAERALECMRGLLSVDVPRRSASVGALQRAPFFSAAAFDWDALLALHHHPLLEGRLTELKAWVDDAVGADVPLEQLRLARLCLVGPRGASE